jgi:hypothetical protein
MPVKLVLECLNRGTGIQKNLKNWIPAYAGMMAKGV